MKKKMKLLLLGVFTFIFGLSGVLAASVEFSVSGPSTLAVGETGEYTISIKPSVTCYGTQGKVVFDSSYLENVADAYSGKNFKKGNLVTEEYYDLLNIQSSLAWVGQDTSKQAGIPANTTGSILKVKFKALQNGETYIDTSNVKATYAGNALFESVTPAHFKVTIGGTTPTSSSTSKATSSSTSTSTSKAATSSSSSPAPTPSTNAKPTNIQVSGYTMSPSFNADTAGYTVTVPASATYVNIVVTKGDSKQTVSGDGNFTLTGDSSVATVTITAEDGKTTKTYNITINKQSSTPTLDGDNTLKDLTVGGTTISGFDKDKTSYSIDVGDDVTSISVAGIPTSSTSTVSVSGATNLKPGKNAVTVTVTAQNGATRVYTINVNKPASPSTTGTTGTTKKGEKTTKSTTTKKPSSDTGVKTINIGSPHTISPQFSNDVDVYNVTVPYDVEKLDLSLYLNDSKATYTVTGNENFQVGKINVVTVTVKAEDGTTRTIIFNVTRTTDEDGTKLTDIGLGGGYTLQPGFDPDIIGYTINVPGGTDKLDLNPKAPEGTTVKTYGNENLKEGWNTILVTATDKNGYTRTYTLSVYKEPKKILGLTYRQFAIVAGIIGGLLLTFFLILLLLARRRKREQQPIEQAPVIDFKPEFNFGSRNGTDDDTVYPNGILNQDSKVQKDVEVENTDAKVMKALSGDPEVTPVAIPTREAPKEIPYDPYDEVVTKDELIDAIEEGLETKNPEKLKMLLEQEELNRKKEEIKRKENGGR